MADRLTQLQDTVNQVKCKFFYCMRHRNRLISSLQSFRINTASRTLLQQHRCPATMFGAQQNRLSNTVANATGRLCATFLLAHIKVNNFVYVSLYSHQTFSIICIDVPKTLTP